MIIVNFDVIARPHEQVSHRLPDPEGIRLWRMLHKDTRGRMMIVTDECDSEDNLETWFLAEGVKPSIYQNIDTKDPLIKADKIHLLAASVGKLDWYIDNDPRACANTIGLGIPTLIVGSPYVIRPEWNSHQEIRPWGDLVVEMDHQAVLRNTKTWSDFE
jgi:hypothetical protein